MVHMSVEEVGSEFSALMNKVRNGEEIVLYQGEQPVAVIKSYGSLQISLDEVLNRVSVHVSDFCFNREEASGR